MRWDLCQQTLRDLGVTAAIELPPAGTLVGLAKRELPGIELLALKSPADLPKAREMISSARSTAKASTPPTSMSS